MITVIGRKMNVSDSEKDIGYACDNGCEARAFSVPLTYGGIDLTAMTFKLDCSINGMTNVIDLENKTISDTILLTWNITEDQLQKSGMMQVQIRAYSESGEKWHSGIGYFNVRVAINAVNMFPSVLPSEFAQMEQRVTAMKDIVVTKVEISKIKASEALSSAHATKTNETNSKTSETNAKTSEINAKISESNAKTSETNSASSATSASQSATLALNSKNASAQSETNAELSKISAKTSENNAKAYEASAENSAISSANSVAEITNAKSSATKGKIFATLDDRLEELDADTYFPATNAVINGDFGNGTAGWSASFSVNSVNGSVLINTGDGTSSSPAIKPASNNLSILQSIGKKVYISCDVKVTNSSCNAIWLYAKNESGADIGNSVLLINSPVINTVYHVSAVLTETSTNGNYFSFWIRHQYVDSATASGKSVEVQNILPLDLTTILGIGNEPTSTEIDMILSKFLNKWFNGTINSLLNLKELFIYINKRINLKANLAQEAIITPTFTNSWVSNSTTVGFYKNSIGEVKLIGSIKNGVLGTSAFILPVGYRPSQIIRRACVSNGAFGYLEIGIDGTVKPYGNNAYIEMGSISFRVDV